MPQATQLQTIENFVKSAGAGTSSINLGFLAITTTAVDIPVPDGHDLVFIVPFPPNPGETVPGIRIGLAGTAHANNLPISGYFPTCLSLGSEGQDVSISSTANWAVEVIFGKTESGLAT